MLDLLRIPRAVLPEVVASSMTGRDRRWRSSGRSEVPIAGIAGDQQAALFGQACFEPGMAKNTYGTGCFLLLNTGTHAAGLGQPPAHDHRVADATSAVMRSRARCSSAAPSCSGCVTASASSSAPATSKRWPRSVADTGGVYLVPAFTGLGSPHWDAYARGTMVGLSRGTTRAHIARAALEAHRLPERRSAARDAEGRRATPARTARRRRRDGERPADAVPGRPARRTGRAAARSPRRPRSARPTSPASASASGTRLRRSRPTGAPSARSSRRCRATRHGRDWHAGARRSSARAAGTSRLSIPPMGKAIAIATPVFFLLIAIEWLVARARGMRGVYRLNDAINSLSLGVMSQVVNLFVRVLTIGIYAWVFQHVALGEWPREQWWAWLLAIVFYDFCYYWNHRLGHESAVFWASHVVHHQSQRYNLSTALRQTSSGALLGWLFYLPMAIAGVPPEMFAVAAIVDLLYQYWIHTELVGKLGRFRPLVRLAVEPPRAPRGERPLHRPQLRRHLHGVGPALRHVRRGIRALRVRHARAPRIPGIRSGPTSRCTPTSPAGRGRARVGATSCACGSCRPAGSLQRPRVRVAQTAFRCRAGRRSTTRR